MGTQPACLLEDVPQLLYWNAQPKTRSARQQNEPGTPLNPLLSLMLNYLPPRILTRIPRINRLPREKSLNLPEMSGQTRRFTVKCKWMKAHAGGIGLRGWMYGS